MSVNRKCKKRKSLILLALSFLLLVSINSFTQEMDEIKYDFSDFEPLTPEKFVENYFSSLKEYYERDPNAISDGLLVIIRQPVSGYRATAAVIQVYRELVKSAVLEWAHLSGYPVGSTVYGSSYTIVQTWNDELSPSLKFTPKFLYTRADKSIEEDFREKNPSHEMREGAGEQPWQFGSSRMTSTFGILCSEKEHKAVSASQHNNLIKLGVIPNVKEISKEAFKNFLLSKANSYTGVIILAPSKYGGWSGSIGYFEEKSPVSGSLTPIRSMLNSALAYCDSKIAEAQRLFYKKMGIEVEGEEKSDDTGNEIVVEASANGYITETRALAKRDLEASEILLNGKITDKEGTPIDSAKVSLRGMDAITYSDENGEFHLFTISGGTEPHSESMEIKLQQIKIEISNEEIGVYKGENFGIVSDGYTTLKLKVIAKGIRPQTVSVKVPSLGGFVEQTVLKVPLVLNADGEGEMEYVPPAYLKREQLTKHLKLKENPSNQYGLSSQIWVAEVPIEITYEDEEGNPGIFIMNILVSRPPILLIHGFTGDESTWDNLGNYLRGLKYETYAREYYQGPADESTIERQSQKIGFYIQKLREAYKSNGILQTRVDIVAHSMGGLMSRYYINNMSKYGTKAGIVIPYDVKLSREQLAAARQKSPVNLIDVRKLIMVGTPNHGASSIDELFGVLGAVTSDYHQLANGQLRSDSEFFSILNAGESEGRHLDLNVQYALLYGIRKRSEFYPPDLLLYPWQTSQENFADDDGVVKISSAKLNGVKDFPFPKDWFAMHGFIHSPGVENFFMGDVSITVSTEIFVEVDALLLEDIPRVPLANSCAKILRANGEASMRYFATENWKPINGTSATKLDNNWCQIKIDEGNASLGFFINGHHWGSLHVQANTTIFYEYASPEFVKVYLQEGKARFRSRKQSGGGFEVIMGDRGEQWYTFNPKAKVRDMNTDFIIEEGESLNIQSINGKVVIGISEEKRKNIVAKEINKKEGVSIDKTGKINDNPLPDTGWWSNIDTSFVMDEGIEEIGQTSFLVNEEFTEGYANWDTSLMQPELIDGKLYWNVGDNNPLTHNIPIPLQNIIIEFDGWTDKNVIGFEWFNSDIKGYNISLGAHFNTKSAIGIKDQERYEFEWFPGMHLNLGSWQHYKFILTQDNLEAYLDDKLIGSKTINHSLGGEGKLIFSSYRSRIGIDNVYIYQGTSMVLTSGEISQQNLVVNGSFEEGPEVKSHLTIYAGVTIPGWEVIEGSIDLLDQYFQASDGNRSIDMCGTSGFGSIQQHIETVPGKTYQVSFDMSGNHEGLPKIKKLKMSAAGQSANFEFDTTGINSKNMGWIQKSWSFVASDDQTNLTINTLHDSGPASCGPCIDNVKVVEIEGELSSQLNDNSTINIHVQNLGEVEFSVDNEYLPASGFTSLQIRAKNDQGEKIRKSI